MPALRPSYCFGVPSGTPSRIWFRVLILPILTILIRTVGQTSWTMTEVSEMCGNVVKMCTGTVSMHTCDSNSGRIGRGSTTKCTESRRRCP